MNDRSNERPLLAAGTRVLNTDDGEPGHIMNGFAYDPAEGGWTEYEVETAYGIERWKVGEFITFAEMDQE